MMKISLKQNVGDNSEAIPYILKVESETITVDVDSFNVPVFWDEHKGVKIYNAEVCGFRVEAEDVNQLLYSIEQLVFGLINIARLPSYMFIARRSHSLYPVYTVDNEVIATTPGGPVFRHVELAKVRDYLSEYLHAVGEMGLPGKSDKLHVRGVNMDTLALIRPMFYLKKRSQTDDENEFWSPVFMADDDSSIYTYAVNGKREVDRAAGHEILLLRSQVAQALIADKRLINNCDLRPDRLLPEYWEQVKNTLKLLPSKLSYDKVKFDMYKNGKFIIAVEYRQKEDRYSLFVGQDENDLRINAARDLLRRNLVSNTEAISIGG